MSDVNVEDLDIIGTYDDLDEEQQSYIQAEILLTQALFDKQKEKIDKIKEEQESNKIAILLLLTTLIKDIKLNEGILNIDKTTSDKLIKKMNDEINKISKNEIINEKSNIKDILNDVVDKSYDINSYLSEKGNKDYKPTTISKDDKNNIMNEKIDNLTHEDRLTNNKTNLFTTIKNEIEAFLVGAISLEILKIQLNKDLDSNKFMSDRLINDQITRKSNGGKLSWMKDNGIKRKIYISVLCSTTCQACKELHGKIFKFDDNSIEIPRHVHCYCFWSFVPIFYSDLDDENITWDNFIDWESDK